MLVRWTRFMIGEITKYYFFHPQWKAIIWLWPEFEQPGPTVRSSVRVPRSFSFFLLIVLPLFGTSALAFIHALHYRSLQPMKRFYVKFKRRKALSFIHCCFQQLPVTFTNFTVDWASLVSRIRTQDVLLLLSPSRPRMMFFRAFQCHCLLKVLPVRSHITGLKSHNVHGKNCLVA